MSTKFKNRSHVVKFLKVRDSSSLRYSNWLNHTAHKKRVWEYCTGELLKTERVLDGNLCNLFAVLMSLFDSDTKNYVKIMNKFPDLEKNKTLWAYHL